MEGIVNIPLTYIQLRKLYINSNDIKEAKNKRPDITIKSIEEWLQKEGYTLKKIRIYNVSLKKNMKYYKIVKGS